jgi:hypothetical protein
MIAAQDLGLRLPVLEQTLDPAYPIDCYPQWWLTEGELYESNPKPFSEYQNFTEYSPKYFAHKDAIGDLQFPEMYEIEKKYSRNDQKLLKRALTAAYKYADINVAIQDGYAIQPSFNRSMGIHLSNLALFDETMNIDEPEFLTYIKSRWNNSYVLAQIRIYSNQKQ